MPLGLNNSSLWVIYLSQKVSEIILYCFTSLTLWSPWQRSLHPWPLCCSGWVTEGTEADKQVDANLLKLWRGRGWVKGQIGGAGWESGRKRLGMQTGRRLGDQARWTDWEQAWSRLNEQQALKESRFCEVPVATVHCRSPKFKVADAQTCMCGHPARAACQVSWTLLAHEILFLWDVY